jgi:hypothetical protein
MDPRLREARMYSEILARLCRERRACGASAKAIKNAERCLKHAIVVAGHALRADWSKYDYTLQFRSFPILTEEEARWVLPMEERRRLLLAKESGRAFNAPRFEGANR